MRQRLYPVLAFVLLAAFALGGCGCSKPSATGTPAAGGGATISGEVTLAPEVAAKFKPGMTLFIVARKPEMRPPVAVIRAVPTAFPFKFTLSQANVMMPSVKFEGEVSVDARLDQDGDAISREPGDIAGAAKGNPVKVGASGVEIRLDSAL